MPCRRWNSQSRAVAGQLEDGGDGMRVVRRELRVEARRRAASSRLAQAR